MHGYSTQFAQVAIPISINVDYSHLQTVNLLNKKRLQDIIVCIFPLKNKSVILAFTRIDNDIIKKYIKQFTKLKDNDKLIEIFYLLLRYKTENYYFSPLIHDILYDDTIREISSIEDTIISFEGITINIADFENRKLKKKLPSLVSEEFSIQNLKINKWF